MIAQGSYNQWYIYSIVNGIFHTVLSQDIVKHRRIIRLVLFDRAVNYIIEENMGKTFSASFIARFLRSKHRMVPVTSIYNLSVVSGAGLYH